ncbi:MAG: hypothetical protein ABJA78_19600 [Ferruginibacter sp.]
MIKRFFSATALMLVFITVHAQYYYKDIISNKDMLSEMAVLKENKVKTISVKSFDRPDEPSVGFFCEKKLKKNYSQFETVTQSYASAPSVLTSYFNKKGLIERTVDSSEIAVNITEYGYDAADRLNSITSYVASKDDDLSNDASEQHLYFYNEKNIPVKMIRVINHADSASIDLIADEKGNIIEEKDRKTNKSYYYYYDAKNRLTDVVYFNSYLRRLLPIFMFEYNSAGQLSQMVTAEEGSVFYYTWKYTYDNGLKATEKCYATHQKEPLLRDTYRSDAKELQGIIEYEYK